MNINLFRYGAQAFNSAQSALGFGVQASPTPNSSLPQNLSSDLIDIDMREIDLLEDQAGTDSLKQTSLAAMWLGAPALAITAVAAAVAAAPILLSAGLGAAAALTFVSGGIDNARADLKQEQIQTEKQTIAGEKQELLNRYEDATGNEKLFAFETIQDIRQERTEMAAEMKIEADESSGFAADQFTKAAASIDQMGTFLPEVADAPAVSYQPPAYVSDTLWF